jgi:SAM-dependent methyltransferase
LRVFIPSLSGTSEFYEDITANDNYYVSDKWEFKQAVRDLKRYKCERVLDIGCGSGDFLALVKKKLSHIEAHGYEFNSNGAESARNRGQVVYSGLFPESVSEGINRPYDALCMFQVIEHFANPVGLIKNALTLLKPEGLLIVSVPNCDGPVRFFSTALTDIPPHHVTRWCEKAFRIGIQRNDLEVCEMRYEPLPSYLWDAYLPVILENTFILPKLGALLNRKGITKRFIQILRVLKVKELWGVTGHSLYVVIKRKRDR